MFSFSKLSFIHLTNTAGAGYELMLCISHLKAYLNGSTSPASDVPSRFRLQPCIKLPNHHGQYQRVLQVLLFITFFFFKETTAMETKSRHYRQKKGTKHATEKRNEQTKDIFSFSALRKVKSSPMQ